MTVKQQKEVKHAAQAVLDCLHQKCKEMPPDQYYAVLEDVAADIEGNIEALREESADDEEDE